MSDFRTGTFFRIAAMTVAGLFLAGILPVEGMAQLREPDKVMVGSSPSLAAAGLFIAEEKGYFTEEGLDVDIKIFKQSTVQVLPLLATNKIDVGGCGYSSGLLNAVMENTGIKMVACLGRHFPGQSHLAVVISSKYYDGDITAEDLKGKTFAVPTRGVIQEIITEKFLERYGLTLDDVELVNLSYPNMNTALANGSIYGVVQLEPFTSMATNAGYAVEIIRASELRPRFQGGILLYSSDFMKKRTDVANRFMTAYLRGVRKFNDFLNGKIEDDREIFEIIKKYTSAKDYEAFKKIGFGGINPYGYLDKNSIQEDINWYFKRGYIKKKPNMRNIVDDSFAAYADQKLGMYE